MRLNVQNVEMMQIQIQVKSYKNRLMVQTKKCTARPKNIVFITKCSAKQVAMQTRGNQKKNQTKLHKPTKQLAKKMGVLQTCRGRS